MGPCPRRIKRLLDVVLAGCALTALSPVLLAIALAIRSTMGSPVLYRQQRPGYKGRPFTLLKFRSMREAFDTHGRRLGDRERTTHVGRLIRRTSLDELPELWNVLRGEMSIVGPRPLLMEYLDFYTPDQMRRHDVRPGMTGWAQVHGRRGVQMQQRIALDVWYVDHWSLRLDARIILDTVVQVLRGQGAEPTVAIPIHQLGWARMPYSDDEHDRAAGGAGDTETNA
jgi:lipopolysaccharide/colanic/teichoic acid biosynthesis glycosyltransferase